jgi:hypothetical protein
MASRSVKDMIENGEQVPAWAHFNGKSFSAGMDSYEQHLREGTGKSFPHLEAGTQAYERQLREMTEAARQWQNGENIPSGVERVMHPDPTMDEPIPVFDPTRLFLRSGK